MKRTILTAIFAFFTFYSFAQIDNEHLEVGEKAPSILGVDQNGNSVDSQMILKEKEILLLFYRGSWCPLCRKHLASLQEHLEELNKKGIHVIVVTPEKVEKSKELTSDLKATFSIVQDKNGDIMKDYKVAFEVNEKNVVSYFNFTKKKVDEHNEEGNDMLPVPATYIIGKDGKIKYVQYDVNYSKRSDFKEILDL